MSIEVRFINKTFGDFVALQNINLNIPAGGLTALLGPSGSGKTTLLRIIAGLESPDSGVVLFHGEDATEQSVQDRKVGFVFQHYALFRHMTVFDNVAFGLKVLPRRKRPSKADIKNKVNELLRLVHIDYFSDRYPSQLSGGQRQRVALARALAVEPKVLMLDEPFGALDTKVRKELRRWLRRLHDELGITSLFVTHDQEEALEVADSIVIMNEGRLEQIGSPSEIYDHPATPFVNSFIGSVNIFHGRVHEGRTHIGEVELETPEHADAYNLSAVAYVRPHEIEITKKIDGAGITAIVKRIKTVGHTVNVELERLGTRELIEAEITREQYQQLQIEEGESVEFRFRNHRVFAVN